ncbi:MAG TPA: S-adenosylmethionine:tRNA ribosyltransferase-isomerase [Vicinamibacterales bacterium]|nr:S-adenosylmethionine:tRNA ribosyltransferase-isomerase [Vicinamibacterales bacterium]
MAAAGVTAGAPPRLLAASEPPEARGLTRDGVRLMVSRVERDVVEHARFCDLYRWLAPGDVLAVNTSATLKAALAGLSDRGDAFELHLSTPEPATIPDLSRYLRNGAARSTLRWVVELRRPGPVASLPFREAAEGLRLRLPGGGRATLSQPYHAPARRSTRLWVATLDLPQPLAVYLDAHGAPIRYDYVPNRWPIDAYQTVFAAHPGSAEMPSAGRPFTRELVTILSRRGVQIVPLTLHTGVSSLEDNEPPYAEYFDVPQSTASALNAARRRGNRTVAVGTTVVRALETATDERGVTRAASGWTDLIVGPDHQLRSVDSLITGLHAPGASHLMMLDSVAQSAAHLDRAYAEARRDGYLWHEFGDSHLLLGNRRSHRPATLRLRSGPS